MEVEADVGEEGMERNGLMVWESEKEGEVEWDFVDVGGDGVRTAISLAKPSSILSKLDNFSNPFSMIDSYLECESKIVTISIPLGVRMLGVLGGEVFVSSLFSKFSKIFLEGRSMSASLKLDVLVGFLRVIVLRLEETELLIT